MRKNKSIPAPLLKKDFYSQNSYSKLITNISFSSIDQDLKTIMVTSSNPLEFKSTVSSNLAYQYAQLEKKVIIVDLDLRHPTIHKVFNVPNTVGVTDYVSKDTKLDSIINKTTENIDVITSGKKTNFVDKILSSKKLKELIDELKTMYDFIIMDVAPVNPVSDAQQLAVLSDGVVFVVKLNSSKKRETRTSIESLKFAKANLLGIVLTNNRKNNLKYSSYYNE